MNWGTVSRICENADEPSRFQAENFFTRHSNSASQEGLDSRIPNKHTDVGFKGTYSLMKLNQQENSSGYLRGMHVCPDYSRISHFGRSFAIILSSVQRILPFILIITFYTKMKAADFSKALLPVYQATLRYIEEGNNLVNTPATSTKKKKIFLTNCAFIDPCAMGLYI
jgi:hypothetical protein